LEAGVRKVVFVGNCQVHMLSNLYDRLGGESGRDCVFYVPNYTDVSPESADILDTADLVIEQRTSLPQSAAVVGLAPRAERIFVPLISGGFLWPFAGQPHPHNEISWFMPSGPWSGENADAFLNRKILAGASPEAAVKEYVATDVAGLIDLDRLLELTLDRQHSRDVDCGFEIAPIIAAYYPTELLFRTPHHPERRLTVALATQLFTKMGVDERFVVQLTNTVRTSPVPRDILPIHPSVIRHFALPYVDSSTRYPRLHEGSYTFEEFALRYMRNEWNRPLEEGIATASSDPQRALSLIEAGLRDSPNCGEGWYLRAEILRRIGRLDEVATSICKAVAAEPDIANYHYGLAHEFLRQGRLEKADAAVRRAIDLDGGDDCYHGLLGAIALRLEDYSLARKCGLRALELKPDAAHAEHLLGQAALHDNNFDLAVSCYRRACALMPQDHAMHLFLSVALHRAGHLPSAVEAARRAETLSPEDEQVVLHLRTVEDELTRVAPITERLTQIITAAGSMSPASVTTGPLILRPEIVANGNEEVGHWVHGLETRSTRHADDIELIFGLGGNAVEAIGDGWSGLEDGGVWSVGDRSQLRLANPSRGGDVELSIQLAPFTFGDVLPSQRLTLDVNGVACQTLDIAAQIVLKLCIPAAITGIGGALTLAMHCPDAARPDLIAEVADDRQLAFSVRRVSLLPMTDPVLLTREADAARKKVTALSDGEVMMRFESLGENCEFGLVQRACGIEPLGLLRFASAPYDKLLPALRARFAGMGEAENIVIEPSNGEYMVHDRAFGFNFHAWALVADTTIEAVHAREVRRMPFLIRKLLDDLMAADKIFVFHAMRGLHIDQARAMATAMRAHGPLTLLWLELSDAEHPDATVERIEPGLIKGYLPRFAPGEDAKDFDLYAWVHVCRAALGLMS
jgi:tetratricopeptide (TPR) repeat protein